MKRLTALLLIGCCVVWSASARTPFLPWDDLANVPANPLVTTGDATRAWRQPWFGLYAPVTVTAWRSLWRLTQVAPPRSER